MRRTNCRRTRQQRHSTGETIRWLQHGLESGYYERQYGPRRSLAEVVRSAKCGSCRRIHDVMYRVPLVFFPQPEGGYTVTSPALPELLTEGDTLEEANANVRDAFEAVVELYAEQGRPLPASISLPGSSEIVWSETLVGSP